MALYGRGVNHAKTLDPSPESIMDPGLMGGKLRVMQDYCTIDGTTNLISSNYFIVGKKLPKGSQVVKVIVGGNVTGLGTNSRIVVGDEYDADRYITVSTISSNNVLVGPNALSGVYYTVTEASDNYIRVASGSSQDVVSSGTIKVSIFYLVE